jgi:hypothetical protein
MVSRNLKSIAVVCALSVMFAGSALAQENIPEEVKPPEAAVTAAEPQAPSIKDISIYGEVQSVDAASLSFKVQYYDYDTDDEKMADISTNDKTVIENVKGVVDIKQGDWVDVMYTTVDSKNMAKTVIVEKEEEVALTDATARDNSSTMTSSSDY